MVKNLRNFAELSAFIALVFCAVLLSTAKGYSEQVLNGVKLWAAVVLPSLFPYFVITALLTSLGVTGKLSYKLSPVTNKIFNTGGVCAYAFFISLISGYPIGAKVVSDLTEKGLLSQEESVRASALCSTSSPMFLLGSVGNIMFNSRIFGLCLFLAHLLSAIIIGFIFSFYKRGAKPKGCFFSPRKTDNILYESVFGAVNSVLFVGGLITVFYLLTHILVTLKVLSPVVFILNKIFGDQNIALAICVGAFECTKGLTTLASGGITFFTLPIAAMLCGFGGLSVICQSLAYMKKAKIKAAPFIIAKLLGAALGFIFGIIFTILFGQFF